MQKRNEIDLKDKITVDINELQIILSVGRNTALRIGEESNAVIRIGKRKLYDVETIKNYLKAKREGISDEKIKREEKAN